MTNPIKYDISRALTLSDSLRNYKMINPLNCIDFYKVSHKFQYEPGVQYVYSNLTARNTKHLQTLPGYDDKVVFFGLQRFIRQYLQDSWNIGFFGKRKDRVLSEYKRRLDNALGGDNDVSHIGELHDLGYLPIKIKAFPEGTRVPVQVPLLTIENTHEKFFWLTNYLETVLSAELWKSCTIATLAYEYHRLCKHYSTLTCDNELHLPFQCHDFSCRGLSCIQDVYNNTPGHLLSFAGTDSVLAIDCIEDYYGGDSDTELIGCSVPASEHSVMMLSGQENEFETFKRFVEIYPSGIVSVVSDTWNLWTVLTDFLPKLKQEILARKPNSQGLAKLVIRPDSGVPEDIICGDINSDNEFARRGALQLLWEEFGGTKNSKGYKILNERVGLIYGDSITLERANTILRRMQNDGFASSNIVFGVGSYTYQYITRDSCGFAVKATAGKVNGEWRNMEKDPVTDGGKKSHCGLLKVYKDGGFKVKNECTPEEESESLLEEVFLNGAIKRTQTFSEIKKVLHAI